MPLVTIALAKGKPAPYRKAIVDGIYGALRETFDVPENDLFMVVHEIDPANFFVSPTYFDIARSGDAVILQLTVSNTRPFAKKQALYRRIVARLRESPGVRPEDVFINLIEVVKENWSFGHGDAQYAT